MLIIGEILGLIASALWIYYMYTMIKMRGSGCSTMGKCKGKWYKKPPADPLDNIRDPREAALLVMMSVAEQDGVMSAAHKQKILDIAERRFHVTPKEAEELFTACSFIKRGEPHNDRVARKMLMMIGKECDHQEKTELVEMLREVAEAETSTLSESHRQIIDKAGLVLGLCAT